MPLPIEPGGPGSRVSRRGGPTGGPAPGQDRGDGETPASPAESLRQRSGKLKGLQVATFWSDLQWFTQVLEQVLEVPLGARPELVTLSGELP